MLKNKHAAAVIFLALFCWVRAGEAADWPSFKAEFISPDGRVIDYFRNRISHSEGQGYAMLLALWHKDRPAFDLVWKWTRENLQIRGQDKLFAWNWGERSTGRWSVIDLNNASDGDTLIALALLLASETWGDGEYRERALEIVHSIREHLIVESSGKLCLLPAYYGFKKPEGLVLNPSYFVFPAYKKFAQYERPDYWQKVHKDSLTILGQSLFKRLMLPADWILFDGAAVTLYEAKSDSFGYEAIRTPLYLAWDGNLEVMPGLREYLDLAQKLGFLPLEVILSENAVSLEEAPGGFYAVFARVAADLGENDKSRALWEKAKLKLAAEKQNYYSQVLYLLSQVDFKT